MLTRGFSDPRDMRATCIREAGGVRAIWIDPPAAGEFSTRCCEELH